MTVNTVELNTMANLFLWLVIQPAREARQLAQRAKRPRRGLSVLWASRRASAQAVTTKWQLRAKPHEYELVGG